MTRPTRSPNKIIVLGAGLGGLAAACLLAKDGANVTLLEKNPSPGGKIQEINNNGFRFDTGPSIITLPEILLDLFIYCDENPDDYLTLVKTDPICRYIYPDGTIFNNYRDLEATLDEIDRIAPDDREAWTDFMTHSQTLYERTAPAFLHNPLYEWRDLKNLYLRNILKLDALTTISQNIDNSFSSKYLQKVFKRFSTYTGSTPYKAPATLNVIPYVEIGLGSYYCKGGMYRIVDALVSMAKKLGVKIQCDSEVKKIQVEDGRVSGVILVSGEKIISNTIFANSDVTVTLLTMIDSDYITHRKRQKLISLEPSSSGFILLAGTNKKWDQLHHHNVFFSSNYSQEFDQIFQQKILPDDPTIYIANTSFTEPGDAISGGSNLFIMVNAPYLNERQNWPESRERYPDILIDKLEKNGLEGLGGAIQYQHIITPVEFQKLYHSNRGSIYGLSSNKRLSAFMRPRNKSRDIEGLYFVGGSTHPGGGIPLVILSARHAVELFHRYELT